MKAIAKKISDSRTEQVQVILQAHINGLGRLFGGRLMEWIDTVGTVVARRHSAMEVITAAVDYLEFREAAPLGSTIVMIGEIAYVGKTSMEVRVDTFLERLDNMERELVNQAYLVYVALDPEGNPTEVPRLIAETPEQQREYQEGQARQIARKKRSGKK